MLLCMYTSIHICIFYKYCMCVWRYGDDIWQARAVCSYGRKRRGAFIQRSLRYIHQDQPTLLTGKVYHACSMYNATYLYIHWYPKVAPLDMFKEVNTKTNLPAQIDLYATSGAQYDFQFIAKGMLLHRYFCVCLLYMFVLYIRSTFVYMHACMCECMLGSV